MPPKRKLLEEEEITTEIPDGSGDLSTGDLSSVLTDFVSSGKNSTVTCGGSIALADVAARVSQAPRKDSPSKAAGKKKGKAAAAKKSTPVSPIAIYWERRDGSVAKVKLPVVEEEGKEDDDHINDNMAAFENFVSDCQPAGFGLQGQDVYDESVRKAWAMDASLFTTNLCPYALGIVDRIEQLLLPNVAGIGPGGVRDGGFVRAELYKINMYQGPSGFFKGHIDTPRGKTQFGSLVLCLPSQHEGGQLTVTHVGVSTTYDWDTVKGTKALQWAALYSDCEHEVLPVTSGHRVTMTFNLYYEPRARGRGGDPLSGLLNCKPAPVDIASLAPYGSCRGCFKIRRGWRTAGTWASTARTHTPRRPQTSRRIIPAIAKPRKRRNISPATPLLLSRAPTCPSTRFCAISASRSS
ncbi:hypothetical protein CLAIMM_14773 [Cladophialophora immunda]|nr:hypothetical protein CLAIMM_14773 [Cladophialophora immunda]